MKTRGRASFGVFALALGCGGGAATDDRSDGDSEGDSSPLDVGPGEGGDLPGDSHRAAVVTEDCRDPDVSEDDYCVVLREVRFYDRREPGGE